MAREVQRPEQRPLSSAHSPLSLAQGPSRPEFWNVGDLGLHFLIGQGSPGDKVPNPVHPLVGQHLSPKGGLQSQGRLPGSQLGPALASWLSFQAPSPRAHPPPGLSFSPAHTLPCLTHVGLSRVSETPWGPHPAQATQQEGNCLPGPGVGMGRAGILPRCPCLHPVPPCSCTWALGLQSC